VETRSVNAVMDSGEELLVRVLCCDVEGVALVLGMGERAVCGRESSKGGGGCWGCH